MDNDRINTRDKENQLQSHANANANANTVTPIANARKKLSKPLSSSEKGEGSPSKRSKTTKTIDWDVYNNLMEHCTLIYGTDSVWDGNHHKLIKMSNLSLAHQDAAKMWKVSPGRKMILEENLVFDPTQTCDLSCCINMFNGIKLQPKQGDASLIINLARFLCSRSAEYEPDVEAILHWLLQWMAYPLQHLGAKLRTAVVMHGSEGTGKNLLFEALAKIYGQYGIVVGQDELEDKFNDWRSLKLLIVGDEVASRSELAHHKNRLKSIITSPTAQINPKNLPRRTEANHANVAFLSNELQPLAIDNSDRRYLVIYTPTKNDFEYYKTIANWLKTGGLEIFYAYLLAYPLQDFDPYAPAPFTQAKAALTELNLKSPERFWQEWSRGELDLPYQSCSTDQVYEAYLTYAERTGERYFVNKTVFLSMIERHSYENAQAVRRKPMNVSSENGCRKTQKMLLVCEPTLIAGMTEGAWATNCVRQFEPALRSYCKRRNTFTSSEEVAS